MINSNQSLQLLTKKNLKLGEIKTVFSKIRLGSFHAISTNEKLILNFNVSDFNEFWYITQRRQVLKVGLSKNSYCFP